MTFVLRIAAQGWSDLRLAIRAIRKAPVVAAVIIGSLGIGIGVNTTVFSWIESRVLNPLSGVADSGSLLLIEPRSETGSSPGMSWLEYGDLRERLTAFRDVIAFRSAPFNVGAADWSERTPGMLVSDNYFDALGLSPAAGRFIEAGRTDPVVVISHDYWRNRFGGAPGAIGQTLRVNDRPLTIIGVAPAGFIGTTMGLTFHLWVPAATAPVVFEATRELENRGQRGYSAIGRLRPRATRADAQRELDAAMREFARAYPDTNPTPRGEVLRFWQSPRGPQRLLISALAILQATMLLVLLAVCGNTANLVLARASARHREVSVRLALGAGRWRIVSLLLTESLVLALVGAGLGAAIAVWGTEALRAVPMPTPGGMALRFDTSIDTLSLAFAMTLGVLSALLFGVPPALQLARLDGNPHGSLRAGASRIGRSRLRDVLMAVEVALALVVLVVAAKFVKSFNETQSTDPGFRREGVLLAAYDLRGRNRSVDAPIATGFSARLLEDLRALPAVESAAIASSVPLDIHGMPSRFFSVEGRARPDGELDQATANTVTRDYFRTMGIPMRAGRDFADLLDSAPAPQAIVNETFVRKYLPDVEPIGRRVETAGGRYTIAGVVADSLYNAFGEPPTPIIYLSYRDRPSPQGEIHVRTRAGAETDLAPELRRVVRALDPALPLYSLRTLTDHVETNLVFRRIPARMFVVIGPLLLVLAAIGIYAVVAYTVSQRTLEIGMRLALGATARRVVGQLVVETLRVVSLGALAGWLIAFVVDRDLGRSAAIDLVVLAGVPAVLLLVATLACWAPAYRASRIDPIVALRQE
jgi:putative ABC transport system permease protein